MIAAVPNWKKISCIMLNDSNNEWMGTSATHQTLSKIIHSYICLHGIVLN
jgi:hypothetical protein